MALTSRVRIAVCLALWQHPCPLRLLRRHLSQSERLWHSVTFSSKRKSVSSKTKPLCQGLSCQESCRADARLRGWTKDAFRLSGITQVLLCTTSPSRLRRATSPSRGGFGIPSRFPAKPNQFHRKRNLFAKGSHFGGAGAPAPERASPVKLLQRRCDTMALTSRVRIAVCLALWQHPCPLRLLRRHLSQSERLWHSVTFFSKRKSVSSKTTPLCQGLPC